MVGVAWVTGTCTHKSLLLQKKVAIPMAVTVLKSHERPEGTSSFHASTCVGFTAVPVAITIHGHSKPRSVRMGYRGVNSWAFDHIVSHRLSQKAEKVGG